MRFRPDIEGLRALAVLLVLAHHARLPGIAAGFIGVDVFFVLSGYLITQLLVTEIQNTGRIDLIAFYARRARRLLPAVALVSAATLLVAGLLVYTPLEQVRYARSALYTFAYLSNIRFLRLPDDYFAPETENDPFLHTWSLAVEEQFYLVWPLVVLLAVRRKHLPVALAGIACLSLASYVVLSLVQPQWAFFLMPARAWEFAIGALAAVVPPHPAERKYGRYAAFAGMTGLLVAATSFSEFTFLYPLLPTVCTAMLLRAGPGGTGLIGRVLEAAPAQALGRLSYGVYLWHWPILVVSAAAYPQISAPDRLLLVAATILVAQASYRLVEAPVRASRTLALRPSATLAGAVALTVCGVAGARAAEIAAERSGPVLERPVHIDAATRRSPHETETCVARSLVSDVRECTFGDPRSATVVVLFGDSHASHWFPALESIAQANGWRLVTLLKSSCTVADVTVRINRLRRTFTECDRWRPKAIARAIELRPDAIVVSNFTRGYRHLQVDSRDGALEAGLRRTLARFDEAGITTLLLGDSPAFGFDVPGCLERAVFHGLDPVRCAQPRERAVDSWSRAVEADATRGFARVHVLDLTDRICPGTLCPPMADGVVVYRDSNHLAVSFVRRLAAPLAASLAPMLPGTVARPRAEHPLSSGGTVLSLPAPDQSGT